MKFLNRYIHFQWASSNGTWETINYSCIYCELKFDHFFSIREWFRHFKNCFKWRLGILFKGCEYVPLFLPTLSPSFSHLMYIFLAVKYIGYNIEYFHPLVELMVKWRTPICKQKRFLKLVKMEEKYLQSVSLIIYLVKNWCKGRRCCLSFQHEKSN